MQWDRLNVSVLLLWWRLDMDHAWELTTGEGGPETMQYAATTVLTATLLGSVAVAGAAGSDSIEPRMLFVLNEIDRFEQRESQRRIIKNNACHDDYGALTLSGSGRQKRAFLLRRIKLDSRGWFTVRSTPAGGVQKSSWEHKICGIFVRNVFFYKQVQRDGGVEVTHLVGRKRGESTRPTQCARRYSESRPGSLYLRAFVNHLNQRWASRNFRKLWPTEAVYKRLQKGPPRQLKSWPRGCIP